VAGLRILDAVDGSRPRSAAVAATVGAVVMCNTHTTGPLWLLLIAVAWFLLKPKATLSVLGDRRYWGMIAVIGVGAAASAWWTLSSGANLPSGSGSVAGGPEIGPLAQNELAWLLQTIAVFPLRNEMAPPAVYVLWLIAFVYLMVHTARGRGRGLVTVVGIAVGVLAVQTILTYVGFKTDGYAWQGRYGLPLAVGLALIPGFTDTGRRKPYVALYHCALLGIFFASGLSVWHVAHSERAFVQRPWTDYVAAGPLIAGLVAALGAALMAWALTSRGEAEIARSSVTPPGAEAAGGRLEEVVR
jgi:hypothetical protein